MTPFDQTQHWTPLDRRAVDTARVLAADAVQKVGNGHPGTAMSLAPAAYLLFQRYLRHDPADPHWLGRDRFVLSIGHASLILYTQLYLSGSGLELDDLKAFRTWGSRTPGHPEFGHTAGVETTTGPLGQGFANGVGMAMAQRLERGMLDPDAAAGRSPFDYNVWVLAGDGDLQEGVSAEAAALAGRQQLSNLVVIWDDNRISIEDDTAIAVSGDMLDRHKSWGWRTFEVDLMPDGSVDVLGLAAALDAAAAVDDAPSLIRLRSIIGWPAPDLQNTGTAHGAALGAYEVARVKQILGFDPAEHFAVDPQVLQHARGVARRAAADRQQWDADFAAWRAAHPQRAALLARLQNGELPPIDLPVFEAGGAVATRKASGAAIQAIAKALPEFAGGSADLGESNGTLIEGEPSFLPAGVHVKRNSPFAGPHSRYGRKMHFGVREHAMGAIVNGMALGGLLRPFCGTFLVFSDYMRPAVRLAALMDIPSTFVWTHDSVGLGEDGPTHQPIEHLWSLRAIPNFAVVRPADANETAAAWAEILRRGKPAGLSLTRQNVPTMDRTGLDPAGVSRGGYVVADCKGAPQVLLLATGSEVCVAIEAQGMLAADGIAARVVSLPCLEWFDEQDDQYREEVLPAGVTARVSVEAGATLGWWRYLGGRGAAVGIDHFGASADGKLLMTKFGITAQAVAQAARAVLAG